MEGFRRASHICTMCSLLSYRWITCTCGYGHHIPSYRSNESDQMLLRGAVFYIAMSLGGPFKVKSLKHSLGSVLPSLRQVSNLCVYVCVCVYLSVCVFNQATQSGHIIVVYEVSLSIARLVHKYGHTISLGSCDRNTNDSV